MKRILQAIAAALVVAAVPHAALAFDADLSLDRFPSAGRTAVSDAREWRGGGRDASRAEVIRAYRAGEATDRRAGFRDDWQSHGWRQTSDWRDGGRYRTSGSVIDVRTLGGAVERGSFYGTAGTANSSVIVVAAPETFGPVASLASGGLVGGPKILDVEADRLDRQPYGKSGLAVAHVGTAKIIRIEPGFRRGTPRDIEDRRTSDSGPTPFDELPPEEQAVTVYPDTDMAERPVDPPSPRVAEAAPPVSEPAMPTTSPAGFREPWTAEWLRDCVARHPGFDASLGTYKAADGKRRFCTGEP